MKTYNFIGNTMVYVKKPYKIFENIFHFRNSFHHLNDFLSNSEIDDLVTSYFYDSSASKKGYTSHYLAKNILENINEGTLEKWADFVELYPENLERKLISNIGEYNIENDINFLDNFPLNGSPIISISEEAASEIIYGKEKNDSASYYRFPDESLGLFTELAKLEIFELNSLKKFVSSFGIPIGVDLFNKFIDESIEETNKSNTMIFFGAAPITRIYMELMEFQNIFNSFIAVKTNDYENAKKINNKRDMVRQLQKMPTLRKERSEIYERIKREMVQKEVPESEIHLSQCADWLAESLTEKVNTNARIARTIDHQYIETRIYNNLFDMAYNQIKDSLLKGTEMKKCEYCGHYFEVQHGKQRFCPPLPFRKRSSCENSYNQDKAKKRREMKENQ